MLRKFMLAAMSAAVVSSVPASADDLIAIITPSQDDPFFKAMADGAVEVQKADNARIFAYLIDREANDAGVTVSPIASINDCGGQLSLEEFKKRMSGVNPTPSFSAARPTPMSASGRSATMT